MTKLILVLLGSFWLSCGNTPKTAEHKSSIPSLEKKGAEPVVSIDTLNSDTVDEEMALVTEEVEEIKKPSEEKEEIAEDKPSVPAVVAEQKAESKEKEILKPDHSQWTNLLAKYVNAKGDVDYKGFQNDVGLLDSYLNYLAENSPETDWSKNEKLAYYINLYNAATVKLILDNYPTRSIKDIKNPWGKDWVKTGDGLLSLGDIEHKILRKMNEPRIHFAINCASFSCPKLVNKAFTASHMEVQLEEATADFINDETRNSISKESMQLSNIFKWYKKDFTENGSLTDYIKPYTEVDINADTDVDYMKYDWNLNEAK